MWQIRLKGCFGRDDKKFGLHTSDYEQAKKLKKELDAQGISWAEVEKEVKRILDGCTPEHVQEEIKKAKRLLCFGEEHS